MNFDEKDEATKGIYFYSITKLGKVYVFPRQLTKKNSVGTMERMDRRR